MLVLNCSIIRVYTYLVPFCTPVPPCSPFFANQFCSRNEKQYWENPLVPRVPLSLPINSVPEIETILRKSENSPKIPPVYALCHKNEAAEAAPTPWPPLAPYGRYSGPRPTPLYRYSANMYRKRSTYLKLYYSIFITLYYILLQRRRQFLLSYATMKVSSITQAIVNDTSWFEGSVASYSSWVEVLIGGWHLKVSIECIDHCFYLYYIGVSWALNIFTTVNISLYLCLMELTIDGAVLGYTGGRIYASGAYHSPL